MTNPRTPDPELLQRWLEKQKERDPQLYDVLSRRLHALMSETGVQFESTLPGQPPQPDAPSDDDFRGALETIVRDGRPALLICDGTFRRDGSFVDEPSEIMVRRLEESRGKVDPIIPLVGRIDVVNHSTGLDFLGTGWLVAEDIVVTNRHVAELLARRGPDRYEFVMGRFGESVTSTVGFGHELGGLATPAVPIAEVVFIESPGRGPDIAFLRVDRRVDGSVPKFIEIADVDPALGQDVVVIGYPARASSAVIPDQDRMERLYGRTYDVKRAAPGKIDDPSRGWVTHDCTTLGGNSGSVVLDLATGRASALHFAGLYLIENYAVPASTLRSYLGRRPWPYRLQLPETPVGAPKPGATNGVTAPHGATLTIPLTVTVSLGQPGVPAVIGVQGSGTVDPVQSARNLAAALGGAGVLAVRPGVTVDGDAMRDETCLVVAAAPERLDEVTVRAPRSFDGLPVQVRPASVDDQFGLDAALAEAPRVIAYDDDARTGPDFRLDWVREPMSLRLHVGPDRGFEELSAFFKGTRQTLVSSIYQFFADHVRAAIDGELAGSDVRMTLVADPQTRDHADSPPAGEFDRSAIFRAWAETGRFENVYVPEGNGGLVDNAYHIKVTVKDDRHMWLSSGNWTRTSQPKIAAADRMDPAKVTRAGNREWHVIADSETLATRFRSHILQDLRRSTELGGRTESLDTTIFVDVPETHFEAIELEAPAERVFESAVVEGELRVKPLLTPDHLGGVYCDAVMELIASARHQLLFQNQYIKVKPSSSGRFGALVDALARASQRVSDCRILLRSDGSGFWDDVAELRRRGVDVTRQVRRLANTHTKGIVVDGRIVLVGSHNWSQSGVTLNRDASLVIDDSRAAAYFAKVFEADWKRANILTQPSGQPAGEAPRLATGPNPPTGFRRVPLSAFLEG